MSESEMVCAKCGAPIARAMGFTAGLTISLYVLAVLMPVLGVVGAVFLWFFGKKKHSLIVGVMASLCWCLFYMVSKEV